MAAGRMANRNLENSSQASWPIIRALLHNDLGTIRGQGTMHSLLRRLIIREIICVTPGNFHGGKLFKEAGCVACRLTPRSPCYSNCSFSATSENPRPEALPKSVSTQRKQLASLSRFAQIEIKELPECEP